MKKYLIRVILALVSSVMMTSCFHKTERSEPVPQEGSLQLYTSSLNNELKDDYLSAGDASKPIISAATGSMQLFGDEDYYFIPANKRNPVESYYYNDKDYNLVTNDNLCMDTETAQAISTLFLTKESFYICMRKYYDSNGDSIRTVIMSISVGDPIVIDNLTYIGKAILMYAEQDSKYLEELGYEKIAPNWYTRLELENSIILP